MKLPDVIRRDRDDEPVPEEVTRDLDALDTAIRAGDGSGDTTLDLVAAELASGREEPTPAFAAELDAWAAAGFPRGERPGDSGEADPSWAHSRRIRRALLPAAGLTTVLVVGVVVATTRDFSGGDETAVTAGGSAEPAVDQIATDLEGLENAAEAADPAVGSSAPLDDARAGSTELKFEGNLQTARQAADDSLAFGDRAGGGGGSGLRRGVEERRVERDAQLTLAAPVDEVPDVTNEAIGTVESFDGIIRSSRTSGTDEASRSTLDVAIPTENLDKALAALSDLADVTSRSEGLTDITRPFLTAKDNLVGLLAERESLALRLAAADTEAEAAVLKAKLAFLNERIAGARASYANVRARAKLSQVTLQITSEGASEGGWSFEEAIDDAGRVLETAAGVALISAAVLLPLSLVAALLALALRAGRGRARERALDE